MVGCAEALEARETPLGRFLLKGAYCGYALAYPRPIAFCRRRDFRVGESIRTLEVVPRPAKIFSMRSKLLAHDQAFGHERYQIRSRGVDADRATTGTRGEPRHGQARARRSSNVEAQRP